MTDVSMTIKVDSAKLEQLSRPGEIQRMAAPIVKATAFIIEGKAKQGAPVLTGFLKNSIQAQQKNPSNWIISDGAEYGIYQELGTRFITGNWFLTRACETSADEFFDNLKRMFE